MSDQALATTAPGVEWTRERIELVKQTVVPQGIPDGPFALFIEQCRRLGLDPLLKEVFCVERRVNVAGRGQPPRWVTKYETQVAEAGLLKRADKFPDYLGITGAAVFEKDECVVDPEAGHVKHTFQPTKPRGKLIGAWARCERRGKAPVVVWLYADDYAQDNHMWKSKGPTMILKCARVAGLRVLFPQDFAGLYIPEEMTEPDEVTLTPSNFTPPPMPGDARPALEAHERAGDWPAWDGDPEAERDAAYAEHADNFQDGTPIPGDQDQPPLSAEESEAMDIEDDLKAATTADELKSARARISKLPQGSMRAQLAQLYNERTKALTGR